MKKKLTNFIFFSEWYPLPADSSMKNPHRAESRWREEYVQRFCVVLSMDVRNSTVANSPRRRPYFSPFLSALHTHTHIHTHTHTQNWIINLVEKKEKEEEEESSAAGSSELRISLSSRLHWMGKEKGKKIGKKIYFFLIQQSREGEREREREMADEKSQIAKTLLVFQRPPLAPPNEYSPGNRILAMESDLESSQVLERPPILKDAALFPIYLAIVFTLFEKKDKNLQPTPIRLLPPPPLNDKNNNNHHHHHHHHRHHHRRRHHRYHDNNSKINDSDFETFWKCILCRRVWGSNQEALIGTPLINWQTSKLNVNWFASVMIN